MKFTLIVLFTLILFVTFVEAEYFSVSGGGTECVSRHGAIRNVANQAGNPTIFVPTNTADEWLAFRNNAPGSTGHLTVSIVSCCSNADCSGGTPFCVSNNCVECTSDAHCPSCGSYGGWYCSGNNRRRDRTCYQCTGNSCQSYTDPQIISCSGGTPYCSGGSCFQCTSNSHCLDYFVYENEMTANRFCSRRTQQMVCSSGSCTQGILSAPTHASAESYYTGGGSMSSGSVAVGCSMGAGNYCRYLRCDGSGGIEIQSQCCYWYQNCDACRQNSRCCYTATGGSGGTCDPPSSNNCL